MATQHSFLLSTRIDFHIIIKATSNNQQKQKIVCELKVICHRVGELVSGIPFKCINKSFHKVKHNTIVLCCTICRKDTPIYGNYRRTIFLKNLLISYICNVRSLMAHFLLIRNGASRFKTLLYVLNAPISFAKLNSYLFNSISNSPIFLN